VAAGAEVVTDRAERGQELLGVFRRFEPLEHPLSSACRPVRVLCPVVQALGLFRELCGEGHKRAYQANRDGETELLVRWALGAGWTWGDPDRPLLRAPANAVPPMPDLDGARRTAGRAARTGPLGSVPQVAGVTRPAGAGPAGGAGSRGHTLGA
jgi:hypothetical protein